MMEVKAPVPLELVAGQGLLPLVEAYYELVHLKQLYRQGWLRNGVPRERCESVAEHSFGVATLAMFLADAHFPGLDRERILRMSLLHDIGEIYAGDLVPGAVPAAEKHKLEAESVLRVLGKLPNGAAYVTAWQEYEAGETSEARLVRQVDRLEMGLQASVYQQQGLLEPAEFLESVDIAVTDPVLREVLRGLPVWPGTVDDESRREDESTHD